MNQPSLEHPLVVKVGGSLYDLPDLGSRLRRWLLELGTPYVILLPGGGAMADVVRDLDRMHQLGEEKAHWLALRSLTLNAHFLAELLLSSKVVGDLSECSAAHIALQIPIMDAWRFVAADETRPDHLPHVWEVTSDSIALRLAQRCRASKMILLKSTTIPAEIDWQEAGRDGFVDPYFNELVRREGTPGSIEAVDFRCQGQASAKPQAAD